MTALYLSAWLRNALSLRATSAILSSFGSLFLVVRIVAFFWQGTKVPHAIQSSWPLFLVGGVLIAAYQSRPHLRVSHILNGRDVTIEIAIGDVFKFPGALVIGTNTTFTTHISRQLISEHSVQGAFTHKFYGDETGLDAALSVQLGGLPFEELEERRLGKTRRYPLGTCVRLDPRDRICYLVAIAELNKHGVASGTFEGVKDSLAELWVFVGEHGEKGSLVMPVIGTGFCRLKQKREEIVHEIIRSFVAACSESTFADKLTIVLRPQDVSTNRISLEELGLFLRHECSYAAFSPRDSSPVGTPV